MRCFRRARPALVVASALAAPMLWGCASSAPLPVSAALDADASLLTPDAVFPAQRQEKVYEPITRGDDSEGGSIRRTLTPSADPPGIEVRMLDDDGRERVLDLLYAADGSVLLARALEDANATIFDPPLVYMPAALAPGESFEATTSVRVVDARGREKSHGTATRRLRHAGVTTIDWRQPPARADVVQGTLELDIPPARVLTTTTFWVTSAGIERERQRTDVRVFGVVVESRRHDLVRVSEPELTPERTP